MSRPAKSKRETLKVARVSVPVSPAARALHSFESSLELPCWLTKVEEGTLAASAFQLVLIKQGVPVARQLCLYDTLAIGRSPGCGLVLDDPGVSRLHARISGGSVVDEESANGTLVNGTPISRHKLQDGDVIEVGIHELVFHRAEGAIPTETAAAPPESEVGHIALGDMTLRIGGTPKPTKTATAAVEVPRRGYLFLAGDTSKLKRKALQMAVNRDEFLIGAAEGADLPLQGFRMPRVVAIIVRGLAGFTLVPFPRWPLKIELSGQAVTNATPLEDGDTIRIGELELTFRHGSS